MDSGDFAGGEVRQWIPRAQKNPYCQCWLEPLVGRAGVCVERGVALGG